MNAHPEDTVPNRRHRVVVIGSGFGGLNAVKKLKRADVDIKLIARTTHHLFQPLLYQVATGIISEGEIAPTTRVILRRQRNVQVLLGDVTHIDLSRKVRCVGPAWSQLRNPLRQPDHRCRGRPVLLRQRPIRRIRARHEVHRRRVGTAGTHPERVRGGRTVQRSGAAEEAAHVHRRRRRTDRRRDGRPDRRTGRLHPEGRLPPHRLDQGTGHPARRRPRGAAAVWREARQASRRAAGEDGRRNPARGDGDRRRPRRHHGQGLRRHHPAHRIGVQGVVGRGLRQLVGPGSGPAVGRRTRPRGPGQGVARPVVARPPQRLRRR